MLFYPTDLIHLAAGEHRANLSEAIREMGRCIAKLEKGLEKGIAKAGLKGKQAGADLLLKVTIRLEGTKVLKQSGIPGDK
jgi:hypothetical protein